MRTALALAVLFAAGCTGERPAPPAEAPPEPSAPAEVRPGASLDRILAPRDDDGPFLAALRAPRAREAAPVASAHVPGRVDTVRTYVYDGLAIEAYEVTGGPTLVARVRLTSGGYGTGSGLALDEARADLEAVLGPPTGAEGPRVTYETDGDPAPTTVEVLYEPDADGVERAAEIVWAPYLD